MNIHPQFLSNQQFLSNPRFTQKKWKKRPYGLHYLLCKGNSTGMYRK